MSATQCPDMKVIDYNALPCDRAMEESRMDTEVRTELERGNFDKAEQLCRTLIRRHDPSKSLERDSLAKAHHTLGLVMLRRQKYSEAFDEFGTAYGYYKRSTCMGENEDMPLARFHMGLISFQQSYLSRARAIFKELARETEGTPSDIHHLARYMIGRILFVGKRYYDAEVEIQDSIQAIEWSRGTSNRHVPGMLLFLGHSLYLQDKWEDAVSTYHKHIESLKEQPGEGSQDTSKGLFHWGMALFKQGEYREAQLLFRDAAVAHERHVEGKIPNLLKYKSWSGRMLVYLREYTLAEDEIRQAITGYETMGDLGKANLRTNEAWLAIILYHQKKLREGRLDFSEALPRIAQILGKLYLQTQAAQQHLISIRAHIGEREINGNGNGNDSVVQRGSDDRHPQLQETQSCLEGLHDQIEVTTSDSETATENDLSQLFFGDDGRSVPYTDSQINKISRRLAYSQHPSWAGFPRTFIVLRKIGQLGKLDDLIEGGFSDYHFPVDELKLPNVLSPSMKQSFVEHQNLVLTTSIGVEHGQHRQYQQDNDGPFERICILGRGGYGQVDKVQSKISYKEYARKQVYRGKAFRGGSREMVEMFISEIQILQRLNHKHIVKLIGSYTDDKYINLLMLPVASMDLAHYLRLPDINRPELRTFYGCLAVALEYLHTKKIRHKDLKPQNILVECGNVLLTDFGLSINFTDSSGSTTFGMVGPCTRKYAAPEVISGEPRNRSSDIWSLGAVYMEMTVVLKGLGMQRLKDLYDVHDSWQYMAQRQSDEFQSFFVEAESTGDSRDNVPLEWCGQMLSVEQSSRPSASALVEKIMKTSIEGEMGFCGICCEAEEHEV